MEKTTISLLELPDSEKAKVLKQARIYLKRRVKEEKYYQSVFQQSVKKENRQKRFSSIIGKVLAWNF